MTKTNLSQGQASASVTLRLSVEERQELKQTANSRSQTLSAYIRTRLFGNSECDNGNPRLSPLERQKLLAQILSELAKSDLRASLKDMAQAAKIGALPLSQDVLADIDATIRHIKTIRKSLLIALGLNSGDNS